MGKCYEQVIYRKNKPKGQKTYDNMLNLIYNLEKMKTF